MAGYSRYKVTEYAGSSFLFELVSHKEYVVVYLFYFGAEHIRSDLQLGGNIDKGADTTFQLEEFIQHHHFLLLKNTIATLEVASFVAYDVFRFIQYSLDLIEC